MGDDPRLSRQALQLLRIFLDDVDVELSGATLIKATNLLSGTVYPILMRLEDQGFLESRWEEQPATELGRPRRRLYRITSTGQSLAWRSLEQLSLPKRPLPEFGA